MSRGRPLDPIFVVSGMSLGREVKNELSGNFQERLSFESTRHALTLLFVVRFMLVKSHVSEARIMRQIKNIGGGR